MGIIKDIKNLLKGLGIAGKHLGRHAITIQYPEQKMEMFERSRGVVILLSDKETGELNCTACVLCEKACPSRAIKIESHRDENKRKHLDSFEIDFGLCCFCGLCEEACNFCAIKMAGKYEFSTVDKDDIIWDVKKLQEVGRDVPYEDTRKKKKPKPAKKPAPANAEAKPAEDKAAKDVQKEVAPQAEPPKSEAGSEPVADELKPEDAKKEETMSPESPPPAGDGDSASSESGEKS